ncbi:MAG TPA: alanine racemase [Gemmatimonadaceae bacterium]|nr:alanine racemase [Gemmatimonadaceae bacterium]
MHSLIRRAWVEVDLGALLRNASAIAAQSRAPLLPMVKADGYGLGAVRVARTLERLDPWGFGVATVGEGEELRRARITRPVLVFTPLLAGDFDAAVRADLTPTLGTHEGIVRWEETGRPWHLSIDTGMNRAGVPWNEVASLRDLLVRFPPHGAFTHFHSAEKKDASRAEQERRFDKAIADLPIEPKLLHAENSPAVQHGGVSRWSLVRPGVFLYGVTSGENPRITPAPVASLHARIVDVRTIAAGESVSYGATFHASELRRIATLAIGYGDGYRRAMSNRACVLVHGQRAPVVGVVTMDMTMIDVTGIDCAIGDAATLIGSNGDDCLTVNDVAAFGDISPYEVLTSLRGRLPRRYLNDADGDDRR